MCSFNWKNRRFDRLIFHFILRGLGICIVALFIGVVAPPYIRIIYASEQTPQETLCDVYNNFYEGANKNIASISTQGTFDNSAPRESNRQLQILNDRILQLMVIQQMKAHGCAVPKKISGGTGYMIDAMNCAAAKAEGNIDADECDQTKWKSVLDDLEHFQ